MLPRRPRNCRRASKHPEQLAIQFAPGFCCRLRHDSVAQEPKSVHPAGTPINHSTHVGFRQPVGWAGSLAIDSSEWRTLPVRPAAPPLLFPYRVAAGVGYGVSQDEDALPLVRRADFRRAEYSPRAAVTIFLQVAEDAVEAEPDVPFDVFKEALKRANCSDMLSDVRPEVTGIALALSFAGPAKRLARVAASDDVNAASKEMCWEGFKIRPKRGGIQLMRLHLRNQVRNSEGFDLHISDDAMVDSSKAKSSFDATVSGAKGKDVCGSGTLYVVGITHIVSPQPLPRVWGDPRSWLTAHSERSIFADFH